MSLLYSYDYVKSEYYYLKVNQSRLSENWINCLKYAKKINCNIFCSDFIGVPLNWYSGVAYYSVADYRQAKTEFEKAFYFFPFNLHVLNNLGSTYVMLKDNSSAEKKYREALHVSNDFDDARINLAILLYNQGRRSECISELKKISNPIIFSNYLDFVIDVVDPDKIKNIKDADTALKELLYL